MCVYGVYRPFVICILYSVGYVYTIAMCGYTLYDPCTVDHIDWPWLILFDLSPCAGEEDEEEEDLFDAIEAVNILSNLPKDYYKNLVG